MSRSRVLGVVLLACAALGLSATGAGAQDYPGTTATTAATTTTPPGASGPLLPNSTVDLTISNEVIVNGKVYGGVLQSTPVNLPQTTAAGHTLVYKNVKLPADFDTNANHTLSVVDPVTGATVLRSVFYVSKDGKISPAKSAAEIAAIDSSGKKIPTTGASNNTAGLAKGGVALLALGALTVGIARRRHRSNLTAV